MISWCQLGVVAIKIFWSNGRVGQCLIVVSCSRGSSTKVLNSVPLSIGTTRISLIGYKARIGNIMLCMGQNTGRCLPIFEIPTRFYISAENFLRMIYFFFFVSFLRESILMPHTPLWLFFFFYEHGHSCFASMTFLLLCPMPLSLSMFLHVSLYPSRHHITLGSLSLRISPFKIHWFHLHNIIDICII